MIGEICVGSFRVGRIIPRGWWGIQNVIELCEPEGARFGGKLVKIFEGNMIDGFDHVCEAFRVLTRANICIIPILARPRHVGR